MTPDPDDLPDSWNAEDAEASRSRPVVWIALGVVVVLLLGAGALYLVLRGEEKTAWPASVGGPPAGLGGTPAQAATDVEPGVYLWSDFDGWHLWVVNGEALGADGISGTISGDQDLASVAPATDGEGTASVAERTITFDLPGEPGVVGIDFNPGFYTERLEVALEGSDGPIDPSVVTVGRDREVTEVPFELEQVPEAEAADR